MKNTEKKTPYLVDRKIEEYERYLKNWRKKGWKEEDLYHIKQRIKNWKIRKKADIKYNQEQKILEAKWEAKRKKERFIKRIIFILLIVFGVSVIYLVKTFLNYFYP